MPHHFASLPGLACALDDLTHPGAYELAQAIERRDWFRLIECRQFSPTAATEEAAINDGSASPQIAICHSMVEAEAEARRLRQQSTEAATAEQGQSPNQSGSGILSAYIGGSTAEIIIFEVEPEIPQYPIYPIQPIERLASVFLTAPVISQARNAPPTTFALRADFPLTPHQNAPLYGSPRSLCLWEESPEEVSLFWTAAAHLERVQMWLRLTARGELHAPDQPLEPLFYPASSFLLVPPALLKKQSDLADVKGKSHSLYRGRVATEGHRYTFIADDWQTNQPQMPFVAIVLDGAPQTHGVIEQAPRTLADLHHYGEGVSLDVLGEMRGCLQQWRENSQLRGARVVLVLNLPSRRSDEGQPEKIESYAFALVEDVQTLGFKWHLWTRGRNGLLPDVGQEQVDGSQISLLPLNVAPLLSRETACQFNAGKPQSIQPKVVAVGAGAIGSQIFLNLARAGWGEWTVVDRDLYLPHNGARHSLTGSALGHSKARACCAQANSLFDGSFRAQPLVADVLKPGDQTEPLHHALTQADIIFDFSAAVAVARTLAEYETSARRLGAFLNPSGTELVILVEDTARMTSLTDLEMQFWRAVVLDSNWQSYFDNDSSESRIRYARSCGDLSARIPQDFVATHAATASRALRQGLEDEHAAIWRWRLDSSTSEIARFDWPVAGMHEWQSGSWTVRASADTLHDLWTLRSQRLPRETGGVLLGTFDRSRKIVHLIAGLPAPSDSVEGFDSFLRGSTELRQSVEHIEKITGRQISYLGEWHSHPARCGTDPSRKDFRLFGYLREHRLADGLPPVMLILADTPECRWFVDEMPEPPESTSIVCIVRIVGGDDK